MNGIKKTFTLIEMLIVIVIIGILAAALVPRLQAVQGRARDSKRKVDLRTIANANEIYLQDFSQYPNTTNTCPTWLRSGSGTYRISGLTGILTSIPQDPIQVNIDPRATGGYSYTYGCVYNTPIPYYDLVSQLENTQDPDRCSVKAYFYGKGNGGAGSPLCLTGAIAGFSRQSYVINPR